MRISIIGTGYVGTVTGACFAHLGNEVICVDVDPKRVESINRGVPPIYEEGLDELLKAHAGKNLRATLDYDYAVSNSDVSFICVPTPTDENGKIDLRFVREASRSIGERLKVKDSYHVVVVKSTVVPQTTQQVVTPILEEASGKKAGLDFGVGMNPEFLREGKAVHDFMHPDRIVIGGRRHEGPGHHQRPLCGLYVPHPGGRHEDRRDDKVRLQRIPRHQDLVLERGRQHL